MDNIQIKDEKKGSSCIRSYSVARGVRTKYLELRYHKEYKVYFLVEGFFDQEKGKVPWSIGHPLPVKDQPEAVAKIEFAIRGWADEGWKVLKQWIKR